MSEQFLAELRSEIAAAGARADQRARGGAPVGPGDGGPGQAQRRPGRLAAMAAVAVLVALVTGVVLVTRPDSATAEVEVIRVGDELLVRLVDVETRPSEIVEAAAAAGLDVSVDEVPVGPSNVGRFIGSFGTGEMPEQLRVVEGDNGASFNGFRIPADHEGTLTLRLGRAASEDEDWVVTSDATAEGEALECQDLVGRPLGDVLDQIDAAGVSDVRVLVPEAGGEVVGEQLEQWSSAPVQAVTSASRNSIYVDAGNAPIPEGRVPPRSGC